MQPTQITKPLFVTYKTDLGGASLGDVLEDVLKEEFTFFAIDVLELKKNKSSFFFLCSYVKKILELRALVRKTSRKGGKIIFQNLKPALFSYGNWGSENGIIISDFSHTLYDWCKKKTFTKNKKYYSQQFLYKKLYKILTFTDNLNENIHEVYGIDRKKIFYVPLPLDFKNYYQVPQPVARIPKVLFVGGEFLRKGGNHILGSWDSKLKGKCELTILTNSKIEAKEGVKVFNSISKGSPEHIALFHSTDIFILPTDRDAYPVVLGEAAVSSVAIITTQYAFGAKNIIIDGKSGFIAKTAEACINYLVTLIENPALIMEFKKNTHDHVQKKFSEKFFKETILNAIK